MNKCILCNQETKNKYCSIKCQKEFEWNLLKTEYENSGEYTSKNPRTAKKFLIEKRGHKCEMCGFSDWLGTPILLIFDHIDGNSDNWKINNSRLICSNCDATTVTYKKRNYGKGRFSRKQRYQEGKSF